MAGRKKPVLTAQLSPESYADWHRYASEHSVTVTALVEALGVMISAGLPKRVETEMLSIAEAIVSERRSRQP